MLDLSARKVDAVKGKGQMLEDVKVETGINQAHDSQIIDGQTRYFPTALNRP